MTAAKVRVSVQLDAHTHAVAVCDVRGDDVAIMELRIIQTGRANGDRRGIPDRILNRVPLTKVRNAARGEADDSIPDVTLPPYAGLFTGHGDERLLPVAVRYATLVRERRPHAIEVLAAEIKLTPKQTADLLVRVRQHGLLTPGRKSVLTNKARKLLEEA